MTDPTVSIIDVIIKGLALLGAGGFFIWKIFSGYNNQNLSLSLKCSRFQQQSGTKDLDLIVSTISIDKGTTAALALEGLESRFKWGSNEDQAKFVAVDIYRFEITAGTGSLGGRVSWRPDAGRPYLYLSPGEKTSFECSALVPRDAVCRVDVVAFGRRRKSTFLAQWRASAVVQSLPTVG
jgi:hypothetical protein